MIEHKTGIMKKRVVITGMGAVSPFGVGVQTFWNNLIQGKSKIELLNIGLDKGIYTPYGALLKNFNFADHFVQADRYAPYLDRAMQFVLTATHEACEQAGLFKDTERISRDRVGVYVGTTTAGHVSAYNQAQKLYNEGEKFSTHNLFQCTPGVWPMIIGKFIHANGPMKSYCISCSAGGESIGNAFRDIRDGIADVIVTGGGDAPISKINYLSFYLIKSTSRWKGNPSEACQPYSKNRPGMVFGEGAGMLVLESYEHAVQRGTKILGEIVNYAANTDGFHIVAPDPEAVRYGDTITAVFKEAGLQPGDIGYISCHGTGTYRNDAAETKAIKRSLGKHAHRIKLSSIKSMLGHAFGGSTALELISLTKSLKEGVAPPTINYKEFDPECDLDCVPNQCAKIDTDYGIKIATGFGGSNNALLLKRVK